MLLDIGAETLQRFEKRNSISITEAFYDDASGHARLYDARNAHPGVSDSQDLRFTISGWSLLASAATRVLDFRTRSKIAMPHKLPFVSARSVFSSGSMSALLASAMYRAALFVCPEAD